MDPMPGQPKSVDEQTPKCDGIHSHPADPAAGPVAVVLPRVLGSLSAADGLNPRSEPESTRGPLPSNNPPTLSGILLGLWTGSGLGLIAGSSLGFLICGISLTLYGNLGRSLIHLLVLSVFGIIGGGLFGVQIIRSDQNRHA